MTKRGEVDAMLCGTVGRYEGKLHHVVDVLGLDPGVSAPAAMSAVLNDKGVFFFVDTHVQYEPSAEQIAESALAAAYRLKLFGIEPRIASRSEEHTSELQSLMRTSYAVFCLKKKNNKNTQ